MNASDKSAGTSARATFDAYLDAHAATDLEGVMRLFARDAILEDPVGQPAYTGREAIREFYRATHQRQGELRLTRVGPALVCGDEAALHVRAAAQASGYTPELDVIYVMSVDERGQIRRLRAFFQL